MKLEELKATIKSIQEITFSKHAEEMINTKERQITKEDILQCIKTRLDELNQFTDQGTEELGHKYKLIFYKSNVYDTVIVISIRPNTKSLNIVTAYIENRAKKGRMDLWLKTRR